MERDNGLGGGPVLHPGRAGAWGQGRQGAGGVFGSSICQIHTSNYFFFYIRAANSKALWCMWGEDGKG